MLKRHVKQIVMVALTAVAVGVCGAMGSIASAQEIQRADVGQRVLPLADDMSKVVVLKGQAEGTSRRDALKRVMGGREQNIPSAPSAMSMDEKLGVLKSAGLKTLSETSTPTSYVTLTPRQPYVANKGQLGFGLPVVVDSDKNYILFGFLSPQSAMQGTVSGSVRFESKGLYLISFTLGNENDSDIFEIELSDGSKQIFKSNGSSDPQRLNIILDAAAGWHTFYLKSKQKNGDGTTWAFYSCDVTALK